MLSDEVRRELMLRLVAYDENLSLKASDLDEVERELSFYADIDRATRQRPNARQGPNRVARKAATRKLSWWFDVIYRGEERQRQQMKLEFVSIALHAVGAVPKPESEPKRPAESRLMRDLPGPNRVAIEVRRALRLAGDPIYDAIERGAAQAYRVELEGKQAPEALDRREEIKLDMLPLGEARRQARKTKWGERVQQEERAFDLEDPGLARAISRYTAEHDDGRALHALYREHRLTPIDAMRKDAALSETCRRLGVSLDAARG